MDFLLQFDSQVLRAAAEKKELLDLRALYLDACERADIEAEVIIGEGALASSQPFTPNIAGMD